jgi:hypothetical protein
VLQTCLAQNGAGLTVANAGVDGQSTVGHIMNFKWWFPNIPRLAPDYILFYLGLNCGPPFRRNGRARQSRSRETSRRRR